MKIRLEEKDKIRRLLSYPLGIIQQRSPMPILSYVLFKVDKDFEVRATDLEVEVSVKIQKGIKDEKEGICVKAENIKNVIEKAEYESLLVETEDDILRIETEKGNFRWKTLPADEYPEQFKIEKSIWCEISLKEMADAVSKTEFSVSSERTRYALNGVFMKLKGSVLEMVSTDGRRMSLVRKRVEKSKGEIDGVIIPLKAMKILGQICSREEEETLEVIFSSVYTGVESGPVRMVVRNIEGQFPDYESVIPTDCDKKFTAQRDSLRQAIVEGSLAAEKDAEAVTLNFEKGKATMSSHSTEGGEAIRVVEGEYEGEDFKISFNPKYLLEPISVIKADTVTLSFKEKDSAAILFSQEESDYKYVVMPLTMD
ncbi:MAG: DNA polymerase III subunit beta [Planctomycetota bacterium]|nr:DNA polymerase III subunit beta [Planctomycetota bacterium]